MPCMLHTTSQQHVPEISGHLPLFPPPCHLPLPLPTLPHPPFPNPTPSPSPSALSRVPDMPVCCQMLCPRAACTASMPPTIALPCAARTRLSCPALTCCPAPPANALPCTLPATRTRASPPLPSIPHADLPYSPRDVCPAARALPCLAPLAACAPAASALPAAVPARCLHSQCTARTLSAPPLRALPALQLLLSYWCRLPRACPALPWTGALLLLRCCYWCTAAAAARLLLPPALLLPPELLLPLELLLLPALLLRWCCC
ncbi:unnamed protein product [Closterium sp. NIES-54]